MRGTVLHEMIHVCDWYRTFGVLAGALPPTGILPGSNYPGAQIPPVDGMDMWPLLSGRVQKSPRQGFPLSQWAIIVGRHKYINGSVHDHESWNGPVCKNCSAQGCDDPDCEMGQWTGPTWPLGNCGGGGPPSVCPHVCDVSSNCTRNIPCSPAGCLFALDVDPLEQHDLSTSMPALVQTMQNELRKAIDARFQTTDSDFSYSGCAPSWQANVAAHKGFAAPMCTNAEPKSTQRVDSS